MEQPHEAFGNSPVESFDPDSGYISPERHWQSEVAIEVEGWFCDSNGPWPSSSRWVRWDACSARLPEAVKQRVAEVLAKRNLQVRVVPYAQTAVEFAKVTDSQLRYATLMAQAPEARLYLLVETRVSYFSDVSGRFSWEVHVRTTAGRDTQQEYGAALQFSHQREDEAQTEVARQIAGQAAGLFDSFLASPLAAPVTDGGPAVRPGLDAPDGGHGGGPELGG